MMKMMRFMSHFLQRISNELISADIVCQMPILCTLAHAVWFVIQRTAWVWSDPTWDFASPQYIHKMHGSCIGPAGKSNLNCSICRWLIVMFPVKGSQGHKASVSRGTQLGVSVNSTENVHLHFFWLLADDSPLPPMWATFFFFLLKMVWAYRTLQNPLGMVITKLFDGSAGSSLIWLVWARGYRLEGV